jgi:transcriptional regulator with XRE-family HTH domain
VGDSNERLRDALMSSALSALDVAVQLGVDRKTVERWVTGRVPHARNRHDLATLVGRSETYLWPGALTDRQQVAVAESEIVRVYPHRANVPADLWQRLFIDAVEQIDILVYSGMWLPDQNPRLAAMLRAKGASGAMVRVLLGDPDSAAVATRGADEGIGEALAGKIRNVLVHYRDLADAPNVEVRLHATTLYTSIYRFDDHLLANAHVYGSPAALAPVTQLRRLSTGTMFETYIESFDKVWAGARPAWTEGH